MQRRFRLLNNGKTTSRRVHLQYCCWTILTYIFARTVVTLLLCGSAQTGLSRLRTLASDKLDEGYDSHQLTRAECTGVLSGFILYNG